MPSHDFGDPRLATLLVERIGILAAKTGRARFMEVCGTHTMEIGRLGLRGLLPSNVELVSGPGCPVCVTPGCYIDAAIHLARDCNVRLLTFGDIMRVPGTDASLDHVRATGSRVEITTTPLRALEIAREFPGDEVVFLGVGFETTTPAVAQCIRSARAQGLKNISFLSSHHLVPPALDSLMADPLLGITGFLLPGHVSAIIGEKAYARLAGRGMPGVIAGFEPLDILGGICALLEFQVEGEGGVRNLYGRIVRYDGNPAAQQIVAEVFEVADIPWRGIGVIAGGGLKIREEFRRFDAAARYNIDLTEDRMPAGCSCGDVLKGRIAPPACPLFGVACTPESPVGPCMVSSEGSCAAYYKYDRPIPYRGGVAA